ncbi:MAG: hypothetical protein U1F77_00575 [Kiritimatiellia bacterium]
MKPNGRVWTQLTRETWWTDLAGVTDAGGRWMGAGFFGDYEVTAGDGGRRVRMACRHLPGASSVVLKLPVLAQDGRPEPASPSRP